MVSCSGLASCSCLGQGHEAYMASLAYSAHINPQQDKPSSFRKSVITMHGGILAHAAWLQLPHRHLQVPFCLLICGTILPAHMWQANNASAVYNARDIMHLISFLSLQLACCRIESCMIK